MVALRSSGSESMYSCGVFASLLMAPPLQMQSCSVGVGLSSIPLGYSISSFLGVWCRNERRNSSAFGPAHEGRCTLSNSESDPEFWILLQTIAVLVLGAWLIDTGLDWSFDCQPERHQQRRCSGSGDGKNPGSACGDRGPPPEDPEILNRVS